MSVLNLCYGSSYSDALFSKGIGSRKFMEDLKNELPPVFTRETASKKLGGLFSPKTLSNLDALHKGPKIKHNVGKKVVYERDDFLSWLGQKLGK